MNIYHECGYPLVMESIKQGSQFMAEFYDAKIKDHAEKVINCPCCCKHLGKERQTPNANGYPRIN